MPKTAHPDLALIGPAGTGKDTVADYLVERYGYVRVAFADPLRELAEFVDPVIYAEDRAPFEPHLLHYVSALEAFGYRETKDDYPEARRFLDRLGRGVREVLGASTWTDALERRLDALEPDQPVVVTDTRFPNEVDLLVDLGFQPLRLSRAAAAIVDAPSERALDDYIFPPGTLSFANDGSLDDLASFLDGLVESHRRALT